MCIELQPGGALGFFFPLNNQKSSKLFQSMYQLELLFTHFPH